MRGSLTDCSALPDTSFPSTHIEYVLMVIILVFNQMESRGRKNEINEAEVAVAKCCGAI